MFRKIIVMTALLSVTFSISNFETEAQETGFAETFALSGDRAKVLAQLVPGTQEFYYYHALHYLNTQQLAKVEQLLPPWRKRFGDTNEVKVIKTRLALLQYDSNPEATLKHIRDELDLHLNHQREIPQAQRGLPSSLDQNLISPTKLIVDALKSRNGDLSQVTDRGLERIDSSSLNKNQVRQLLARIAYPDFPNLVVLVDRDLRERDSQGFGSLPIHAKMTLAQLNELANRLPNLWDDDRFVAIQLQMQRPSEDVDLATNREAYQEYLARLWTTVEKLSPKFNSLKANVLYHQLDEERRNQRFDEAKFQQYLSLPRRIQYVNPQLYQNLQRQDQLVNLSANYSDRMTMSPIGNEEELVDDYLLNLFRDKDEFASYEPLLRTGYLKQKYATAKILAGKGDGEQWASMLSPEEYKALVSRVDLEFSPGNPEYFSVAEPVQLELLTKNVDNLIVKVFEINSFNYYRKFRREIDTDINLDGLVPNSEQTYSYDDAPAIQVKRKFNFDEIKKPGVYVIDFIGNGKSSRALIRMGRLSLVESKTIAGHGFKVIDRSRRSVKDFDLWISGRRYKPNENGLVVVPYSTSPGRVPVIISQSGFSCLDWFQHASETYRLSSAIVVDRESLLRSEVASILIRPLLFIAGIPTDTDLLTDVQVQITTTNLDGISAIKSFDDLKFGQNAETVLNFVVPPRLMNLQVALTAKVENISQGNKDDLSVSRTFVVNQIDQSDEVQDVHLVPHAKGYSLEVLGKTGESRPNQAVTIELYPFEVTDPVRVDLQSDENGMIELGELKSIVTIQSKIAGGTDRNWNLLANNETHQSVINSKEGDPVFFAAPADLEKLDRDSISLFEVRQSLFYREHFDSISLVRNTLKVADLAAGDYVLRFKNQNRTVSIRVSDATPIDNILVGNARRLEQRRFLPVTIDQVENKPESIELKLANANDWTRVHVFASRYAARFNTFENFNQIRDVQPWADKPAVRRSVYMSGRQIGDEYKYILDRKYASKHPGNMLDRPTLLLNPWKLRDTNNQSEVLAKGDEFEGAGVGNSDERKFLGGVPRQASGGSDFANLDFLMHGSHVLANLRPDKNGVVSIDRKQLGDRQHLQFYVADAYTTMERTVNLEVQDKQLRDLRLANVMDPDSHFSQSRDVEVINKDQTFEVKDILSARFQYFDDLGDVFRLLNTLNSNALDEFSFVLDWNKFDDARKKELYSQFACHELNYFLFQKDGEFFKTVVRPHLVFKRDQTFMDQYLLGDNLAPYTEPRQYERLNVFEKILLAQQLESQRQDIARNIEESYQLAPTRRQYFGVLFDTALASTSFGDDTLERAKNRLNERFRQNSLPDLALATDKDMKPKAATRGGQVIGDFAAPAPAESRFEAGNRGGGLVNKAPGSVPFKGVPSYGYADRSKLVEAEKSFQIAGSIATTSPTDNLLADFEALIKSVNPQVVELQQERLKEQLKRLRDDSRRLYRRLRPTEEWIENNYWHIAPDQQSAELVTVNRFWNDFAKHKGGTFLSPYFSEANKSFTEMMFALSVLDLPFEAPKHDFKYVDASMSLKTAGPMIALHQQVQPAIMDRGNTSILVSENCFQKNNRYRFEDGVQYDKFLSEDFVAHTLYGGQVVVTNPTSTPQAIDILIQIPQGAVVASGSRETQTIQKQLDAFSTQTYEYFFYFPTAGQFTHFPAHVAAQDKVLAVANPITFVVSDRPAKVDTTSWNYISQNGTDEEVIKFLNDENILRLDLEKIAFRMKEKPFFQKATQTLRERLVYNHTLWSYSVVHNDPEALAEFLDNESRIVRQCAPYFKSRLISVDPIDRRWYFHREYRPLLNARSHQVGSDRKILNPEFREQYLSLMNTLANKPEIDNEYQLVVTYYMLLQDRIDEALASFEKVERTIETELQYDYCDAYLDMYREKPDQAAAKAEKWSSYPVDHWRKRFQAILAQVKEVRGGQTDLIDSTDSTQSQTALAAESESFDFDIEARKVTLNYQNIEQIKVNYYEMDIELLFSRSPFAQDELDGFSMIRPNHTDAVTLDAASDKLGKHEFELPGMLENKNVLVEIVAGDQAKSKPYFANSLSVQIVENYGQLKVTSAAEDNPIPRTYVKVYTRDQSGQVKFHKDGYTDLRGRFDYVSQSNNSMDGIEMYSVLILHPEFGAVVRQVAPPKE